MITSKNTPFSTFELSFFTFKKSFVRPEIKGILIFFLILISSPYFLALEKKKKIFFPKLHFPLTSTICTLQKKNYLVYLIQISLPFFFRKIVPGDSSSEDVCIFIVSFLFMLEHMLYLCPSALVSLIFFKEKMYPTP